MKKSKKSNDKKKIDELKQIEVLKDKKIVFFTNGELKSLLERRYVNTMILQLRLLMDLHTQQDILLILKQKKLMQN